jgi:hypothetical protein
MLAMQEVWIEEEKRMARRRTWEISDEFWALVEPLLPTTRRDPERIYKRKPGGGKKAKYRERLYFAGIVDHLERVPAREIRGFGFVGPAPPFPGMGEGGIVLGDLAQRPGGV